MEATAVHSRDRTPTWAYSFGSKAYCSHALYRSLYDGRPTNQPDGLGVVEFAPGVLEVGAHRPTRQPIPDAIEAMAASRSPSKSVGIRAPATSGSTADLALPAALGQRDSGLPGDPRFRPRDADRPLPGEAALVHVGDLTLGGSA